MKTSTPKSSKRKVVETDNVSPTVPTKQLFQREEQYFGFNPISFLDDISNAVDDFCASEVDQIEQEFEKYEEFKDSEKEIQNGIDNLLQFAQNSFDRNFDLFEMYSIRNIFPLPKDFDLNTSQINSISSETRTEEEKLLQLNTTLDLELEELKKNIEELYEQNLNLKGELNFIEQESKKLQAYSKHLQFITATCKSSDIEDIAQTSKKITEQMTELLGLMQTMNFSSI